MTVTPSQSHEQCKSSVPEEELRDPVDYTGMQLPVNEVAIRILHRIESEVVDPTNKQKLIENAMFLSCKHSISLEDYNARLPRCPTCDEEIEDAVPNVTLRNVIEVLGDELFKEDFKIENLWKNVHNVTQSPVSFEMMESPLIRSPCGHSLDFASHTQSVEHQKEANRQRTSVDQHPIVCEACRTPFTGVDYNRPLKAVLKGIKKQIAETYPTLDSKLLKFILDEIDLIDELGLSFEDFIVFKEDTQKCFVKDQLAEIALLKENDLLKKVSSYDSWTQGAVLICPNEMIQLAGKGVPFERLLTNASTRCLEDPSAAIAIFDEGFFDEELLALGSNDQFLAIKNAEDYIQRRRSEAVARTVEDIIQMVEGS